MMADEDTIAALATPPGTGAVAMVRISGPGAFACVDAVWRGKRPVSGIEPRRATLGRVVDGKGRVVDECLLTRFVGPSSYTGEDVVELCGHGGVLVARAVLEAVLEAGARLAGPGEFSQRAFLNGRMDLTQAEAVMDLIGAQTELAMRAAHAQLQGVLGSEATRLRDGILGLLAHVEAYIDFPDEDIDPETGGELARKCDEIVEALQGLLATAERGRVLRHGVRTVLAGAANAGKSSLLNRFLGYDRAIVSELAGTTRDTVEEVINFRGIPLRLVDTAGIRESDDALESAGIARTEAAMHHAELLIEVIDGSLPPDQVRRLTPPAGLPHHLVVLNKADLGCHPGWEGSGGVALSCLKGTGLEALEKELEQRLLQGDEGLSEAPVAINSRHRQCLQQALEAMRKAVELLRSGGEAEWTSIELREALDALGDMVGRVDAEDLLGEIFGRFCIGK